MVRPPLIVHFVAVTARKEPTMAKACYSTVFAQSAADIWNVIRDFNNYLVERI
jgi:hypothetical protein